MHKPPISQIVTTMPVIYKPRGAAAAAAIDDAAGTGTTAKSTFDPSLYPSLVSLPSAQPSNAFGYVPRGHAVPPSLGDCKGPGMVYEKGNYPTLTHAVEEPVPADHEEVPAPEPASAMTTAIYAPRGHAAPPHADVLVLTDLETDVRKRPVSNTWSSRLSQMHARSVASMCVRHLKGVTTRQTLRRRHRAGQDHGDGVAPDVKAAL